MWQIAVITCSHSLHLCSQRVLKILENFKNSWKKAIFPRSVWVFSQAATPKGIRFLKSTWKLSSDVLISFLLWHHFQGLNLGWKLNKILLWSVLYPQLTQLTLVFSMLSKLISSTVGRNLTLLRQYLAELGDKKWQKLA